MAHFPIFTDLAGRKCLVVGEGESAEAKVRSLLDAGAVVTLIAKQPSSTADRVANDRLVVIEREYRDGDMESFLLVYGCTTDRQLAQSLFAEASRRKVLINIPDMPSTARSFHQQLSAAPISQSPSRPPAPVPLYLVESGNSWKVFMGPSTRSSRRFSRQRVSGCGATS